MAQVRTGSHALVRDAAASVVLLVGEHLDAPRRQAVARAERPKVDMFEVEAQTGAVIRDFSWLRELAQHERLAQILVWCAERSGFWHFWLALRVLCTLGPTTIIYATGEDVGIAMALLLRLTRRAQPALIMRLEEPVYGRTLLRRTIIRSLVRFGLARVTLTLARSHAMVRRVQHDLGVPAERVRFAPEGVDLVFFNSDQPPAAPGLVAIPEGPYLFGAGLELRDYPTLIAAVRDLPVQVIIGAGSPWSRRHFGLDPEDRPTNVTIAAFTPLQMRELYRHASLVVVPVVPTTRSCGASVCLEALAMGRPLVATATAGLRSYFEDGVTAALVPAHDPAALRARITALLDDPAAAAALAARGQQHVRRAFDVDQFIQTLIATINRQRTDLG